MAQAVEIITGYFTISTALSDKEHKIIEKLLREYTVQDLPDAMILPAKENSPEKVLWSQHKLN
ncbi:hypothetical protein SDC9_75568 [bioreactor metagenome]|uniref:Uncharacterized protein n=1 Tax=bioreactor metagenome TaxID=1076179 RepID=A0A644YKX0_9ZZZZ